MVQDWFGFTGPQFRGDGLVAPVLGTAVFVYGGSVFLTGAWSELRQRAPGMMLLVSLAISVAFLASAAWTLGLLDLQALIAESGGAAHVDGYSSGPFSPCAPPLAAFQSNGSPCSSHRSRPTVPRHRIR